MLKKLLILCSIINYHLSIAQSPPKIVGPIGVYHLGLGYAYADTLGIDSVPLDQEIPFGELALPSQEIDNGMVFTQEIDSCVSWKPDMVIGIIQPPGEGGVYNQPADTSLYTPYLQSKGPGMIQSGQRFSRLSQLYGGFCGVVLDDWNEDIGITLKVHDAVQGKPVDDQGNVYSTCPATTPYNKLYVVKYHPDAFYVEGTLSSMDGLAYFYPDQNCCYTNINADIAQIRINWPHKEILGGIYLRNSGSGWLDPAGVQYLLVNDINAYDDGYLNGIILFAGVFMVKDYMPLSVWNSFAFPTLLDSLYYPCLGIGAGKINDCSGSAPLSDAFVTVYCTGRLTGDTLLRSRQKTDSSGQFQVGLWAGNRSIDSTQYWFIATKEGYLNDTGSFWITRNGTTVIPPISLCPQAAINPSVNNLVLYPNPTSGVFTVKDVDAASGDELKICNLQGQIIYESSKVCTCAPIDISAQDNGAYVVYLKTGQTKVTQKGLLLLQR